MIIHVVNRDKGVGIGNFAGYRRSCTAYNMMLVILVPVSYLKTHNMLAIVLCFLELHIDSALI